MTVVDDKQAKRLTFLYLLAPFLCYIICQYATAYYHQSRSNTALNMMYVHFFFFPVLSELFLRKCIYHSHLLFVGGIEKKFIE
jgi:hypothetical protein